MVKDSSNEAQSFSDAPSYMAPKGGVFDSESDEVHISSSESLNKSSSSSKRPRLDPSETESTAQQGTLLSIKTTEAKVPKVPKPLPGSSDPNEDPTHISTAAAAETRPFPSPDPLTSLPLELFGDILIHTRSTKDILHVARCSKRLWKTLCASSAAFVWKKTRRVAVPEPMPDPPSVLSECAYASMVFHGGKCEVSVAIGEPAGLA